MPDLGRDWTPELVARRLRDSENTVARLRRKIARDPGSIRVPIMENKIAELDVAIQMYRAELTAGIEETS